MAVVLAARDTQKLAALAQETGAQAVACDATQRRRGRAAVRGGRRRRRAPRPRRLQCERPGPRSDHRARSGGGRQRDPGDRVRRLSGGPAGGQRMLRQGHGTILFTGASASVKGYPRSSSFAMGKFALRGLAQSLARELQPQNIHVGHIVIDGGIGRPGDPRAERARPRRAARPECDRRRPICSCTASTAAPGPGRSSCVPGSRISESARAERNGSDRRTGQLLGCKRRQRLLPTLRWCG